MKNKNQKMKRGRKMTIKNNPFQNTIDIVDSTMKCWDNDPQITEHYKVYYRTCRILESTCSKFHEQEKKVYVPTDKGGFTLTVPSCLDGLSTGNPRCTPEGGCDTCRHDFLRHCK